MFLLFVQNEEISFYLGFLKLLEIILIKNGLHCRIEINPNGTIGAKDIASINDIHIESAITTIIDFEDRVATVDAEDKIMAYRNWLGLIKGNLST